MMKRLLSLLLMTVLSLPLMAQNLPSSDDDLTSTFTENDLEEIDNLREGAILKKRDVETGLFMKDYNTESDQNRLSFLYHGNTDFKHLTDIQTLEAIYAHRFNEMWFELFGFRTAGKFKSLTANNPNEGSSSEDLLNSSDTVTAFGASIALRDSWIGHLLNTEKIFTTTSAGIGWYSFQEKFRQKTYSGPGLKADFGIHRRASRTMHYGLKMSYHLASVRRAPAYDKEPGSARGQTLTWLTLGFDVSFYF